MTALDVALAGRWTDWHGLDPDLTPDQFAARHPGPVARPVVRDGRVALVELDDPMAPGGVESVLAGLGEPALVQPARLVRYRYRTTDHVYPSRGLALVVAVAYDHGLPGPPPDRTPHLVRAELFVPTDLDGWRAGFGRHGATPPPLR